MKDWAYTFDSISKSSWMQQIGRDLKGKSMTSLQSEWWPGTTLEPFHHEDDHHPRVTLPSHLFTSPPVIAEWVDARGLSAADLNKQLLEALRFGAAQLILQTDEKTVFDDDAWLKDIHADMVTWHFLGDHISPLFQQVRATAAEKVHYRIARTIDYDIDQLLAQPTSTLSNCRLVYSFPSGGHWIAQCAEVYKAMISDAGKWKAKNHADTFFDHCILAVEADTDYLKSIIQLRSLQVVWQNMITLNDKTANSHRENYLESHIVPTSVESPDHFLIRATTAALGSALAGAPVMCIHPHPTAVPGHYRRINRNVHHLLHMESGLPRQCDPLAGAYAIDHYTADWSEQIWAYLDLK